ncbi:hypothetical protein OEZ86_009205 [Tetradesmus obliquus]|nr:hypothetical protein OEZ86_009205 [Tetradesmus obliquus]
MQPFGELTNRTPSPAHPEADDGRAARKHSPWTAARQKKKTRSVHSSLLAEAADVEVHDCDSSPVGRSKTSGCCSDLEAEYSLADGLSPTELRGSPADSPHSSPPIDRDQDAELHPAKAYIVDQQGASDNSSPDLLAKFALAANINQAAGRSPKWFGSAALQDELDDAAEQAAEGGSELQHSSSAPSNVLFHQFDAAARMQQQKQLHLNSQASQLGGSSSQAQFQAGAAAAAAVPGRRRGLVARRRSWTGAESRKLQQGQSSAASGGSSSTGISRLAASSCMDGLDAANPAASAASAPAAPAAAAEEEKGFQLHSRLGNDSERQSLYEDVLQRLPWEDIEDDAEHNEDSMQEHSSFLSRRWGPQPPQRQQRQRLSVDGCLGFRRAAAEQLLGGDASEGSVEWYEERLLEAAEEGDLATAQQLWGCMQAAGTVPSRKVMTSYLMCCYYGGSDPVEAEQVVRQMCLAADTEPDGATARLLASIDISWQQLHCGC